MLSPRLFVGEHHRTNTIRKTTKYTKQVRDKAVEKIKAGLFYTTISQPLNISERCSIYCLKMERVEYNYMQDKAIHLNQGLSALVLKSHCSAALRRIPVPTHLNQMNDSLPGLCRT
ncbi:hypothetical protein CRENBAI_023160 [Crenichthys baileyi]|uniref:Uncharacterized protein n=1 Tax=Crenichthys baileyi TaxID=28760 RepID=A0AAV9SGS2_9TELE